MKLADVYKIIDEVAPKTLSDEYCQRFGAYDNSGILIDTGADVTGVTFSLDFSLAAINAAKQSGANLIVTHHPAIYGKIGDIRVNDFQPLGEKLATCLKHGISVISMHLNLDSAIGGIDESLAQAVGSNGEETLMHTLSAGGYGRAYIIQQTTLLQLAEHLKTTLHTKRILIYGEEAQTVTRVASFCGGGADEEAVAFAYGQGANVLISADIKHHVLTLAQERGIAVIALTHYASENYGFEKFYQKIRQKICVPCGYHTDESFL